MKFLRPGASAPGMTLTETIVALVALSAIVGLAAVSILAPTSAAENRQAQAMLDGAVSAQQIVYRSLGAYTSSAEALAPHFPEMKVTGPNHTPSGPTEVSIFVRRGDDTPTDWTDDVVGMAAFTRSGTCFLVRLDPAGTDRGITYGRNDSPSPGECTGTFAVNLPAPSLEGDRIGSSWERAVDAKSVEEGESA